MIDSRVRPTCVHTNVTSLTLNADRARCAAGLSALFAAALAGGCAGSADVRFVSLDAQEIDPPAVDVLEYAADRACWHVNDAGELVIGIRAARGSLLFSTELLISLVPGGPPAGSGRNYNMRDREVRVALVNRGGAQRLRAYRGVMTVSVEDSDTITGSFRVFARTDARLQLLSLLPPRPHDFLCFGTFRAVRSARRAEEIREQTEAIGGKRAPVSADAARQRPES